MSAVRAFGVRQARTTSQQRREVSEEVGGSQARIRRTRSARDRTEYVVDVAEGRQDERRNVSHHRVVVVSAASPR